jgi:acyl carrier protein
MTSISDIESRIAALITANTKIDVKPGSFDQDLHLDSLAMLEIMIGLESEYGIEIDETELDLLQTFQNVNSITKFVYKSLKNGSD